MCRALRKACITFSAVFLIGLDSCAGQGPPAGQHSEFWGFTGPWESASTRSVRTYGGQLDAVINGWITIDSASALPVIPSPYPDTVRPLKGTPRRMAIVTSWHGEGFHTGSIRLLGSDATLLAKAAGSIGRYAQSMRYSGLVLDFEALEPPDLPTLVKVARAIADSAHARGIETVAMAIPASDPAYPARPLLGAVDALVVMLYDQHWAESGPGPIAEASWVKSMLAQRVAEAGPQRLIAALPAYGYRWRQGRPTESIGYAEAVQMAIAAGAPLTRDDASGTLRSRAPNGDEIWVADATLFAALIEQARSVGVNRFAIWRLGEEDPGIWRMSMR
jgi:peptidoglycan-N-acetylglucosamine deacetylase